MIVPVPSEVRQRLVFPLAERNTTPTSFTEYPTKAPQVNALTTNAGRTRFNPNIYAGGKVCLSILGTWRGEKNEEWSSAQGLESILISIQSLMSPNPYENEPGFEDAKTDFDKKNQQAYIEKVGSAYSIDADSG